MQMGSIIGEFNIKRYAMIQLKYDDSCKQNSNPELTLILLFKWAIFCFQADLLTVNRIIICLTAVFLFSNNVNDRTSEH